MLCRAVLRCVQADRAAAADDSAVPDAGHHVGALFGVGSYLAAHGVTLLDTAQPHE